jgi:hypothetical protein
MVYLDVVPVNCSKDPPAGTRGHRTDRDVVCCIPPAFPVAEENTSLAEKPVHPVLCGAAGKGSSTLDISDGKKSIVKSKLPHQAQVLPPSLKYAGHTYP